MSHPIEFNNVWKKFKKGEKFNSLRDSIPNMFREIFSRSGSKDSLEAKEFWAVKDVSFQVKKGEVVGIIGPNGAGKSTILKLLSRIMMPTKGDMAIKGRLSALIEVTAGFHPELTGKENAFLNGTILGMKRKEIEEKYEDIVEFSGLGEFMDTPVKRYSSGMYSRLGFSVASHVDPDVLLVDEVLAVGDIAFQAKCAQKMRELLKSGTTIILVSHNLSLVQSLCQRVILLNHGEIIREGTPQDVIPYYENIIFKQREEEFKRKIVSDGKVKVDQDTLVVIEELKVTNPSGVEKKNFNINDKIKIHIGYNAKEKITEPVFSVDVIRADGVLCCASNTKMTDCKISEINGKGIIRIDLSDAQLAPGIYLPKVTVWDKDMIHPFAVRKNDVFSVSADASGQQANVVFLPDIKWDHQ